MEMKFPLRSKPAAFTFMGEPRLMNCFAEEIGEEQKTPIAILAIPGQTAFSAPASDPCRGMFSIDEDAALYSAHLSTLYRNNSAGVATAVTGTLPGSGPIVAARGSAVARTATVTISIASPGVVTDPLHRLQANDPIVFSTDGDLPTGITADTTYYVRSSGLTPNQYTISATSGGAAINTSGDQTGAHTRSSEFTTVQVGIVTDAATFILERDTLYFQTLRKRANSTAVLAFRHLYFYDDGSFDYSAINDATAIAGFAEAEKLPDGLVRGYTYLGSLLLAGSKSIEPWVTTNSASAPFRPLGGAYIPFGLAARDSMVEFNGGVAFVSTDKTVRQIVGSYQTKVISDHSISRALSDLGEDVADVRAFVHNYNGHEFLVLTCDAWTKALDAVTGLWHDRSSYQRLDWRAWPHCEAFGLDIVGDKASGGLRYLDAGAHTEAGDHLVMEMTLPDISAFPGEVIVDRMDIDIATGQGLNVAPAVNGYDPKVWVWASRDGGHTWGQYKERSAGKQGEWLPGVRFNGFGMSKRRGWRFKIGMSAPCGRGFALGDIMAEKVAA